MEILESIAPYLIALLSGLTAYLKTKSERIKSKQERDRELKKIDLETHDKLLQQSFEISSLKDTVQLHNTVLEDLRNTMDIMNSNVVKLQTIIEERLPKKKD